LAKNEEGEFELILGNRQLISVFLIVVILLGVFFSMGYIVGRNSAPTASADTARNSKVSDLPPPILETPTPATPPAPAERAQTSTPKSTHPAQPEKQSSPPPVAVVKPSKPSPAAPAAPTRAASSFSGDPSPGDYWQVVATSRPDAEIITETLAKKGFHAVLAPAPKEGIFRVLVGPLKDSGTQAQTRTQLEAAGFKNPIVRKY
jgi:cell division septation protein DedD